jgi:nitroimidazol reductase NimA-like FMN-containing flavoprotein (pyridoxamine 5'-phosphate oxidase superfamily)
MDRDTDADRRTGPEAVDVFSQLGEIGEARCLELLRSTPIGRVGFVADGAPLILPVNYVWFQESIAFRTVEGQKLAAAAEGQAVCFEVDSWDAERRTGWSVLMKGVAREVTGWAEQEELENLGLVPWARDQWRRMWVRIEPREITGRFVS